MLGRVDTGRNCGSCPRWSMLNVGKRGTWSTATGNLRMEQEPFSGRHRGSVMVTVSVYSEACTNPTNKRAKLIDTGSALVAA